MAASDLGQGTMLRSPEELDALAQQAGAEHADRIVEILRTFPADASQEILDMGARSLEGAIEIGVAALRVIAPEDQVERFGETIRRAYAARLLVVLAPAEGRG